ncbi:MAG: glutathione S-transferase family protein [Deltaproteobacteria bacterium]|nr:glutathione S-transferase family protein [Deltaproteobacteria bacterium]
MLRLHHHPMSPYGRKVWTAMVHRGDSFDSAEIELGVGALQAPEFKAISPFGKMPVLETEDGPIIESTSIIEWLEARGPRVLLPEDRRGAWAARHFDRLADLYLVAPMSTLWWEPKSEAAKETASVAATAWQIFARQLEVRPFVAGDRFTLGDLAAAIATDYLERLGVPPPPPIAEWKARCFAVPAMAATLDAALRYVEPTLARRAASLD